MSTFIKEKTCDYDHCRMAFASWERPLRGRNSAYHPECFLKAVEAKVEAILAAYKLEPRQHKSDLTS